MKSNISYTHFLFTFLLFLICVKNEVNSLRPETADLIKEWAPILWLHPEDPFFPSNVDFYLENMEVKLCTHAV
jgi:hypothetical protein